MALTPFSFSIACHDKYLQALPILFFFNQKMVNYLICDEKVLNLHELLPFIILRVHFLI